MILREHLLNAGRGPQTSKKGKKHPHNWIEKRKKGEREKRKKKKGIRTGPALLRGSCERGKESTHWGALKLERR